VSYHRAMRSTLSFLVALCLSLAVASCGDDDGGTDAGSATDAPTGTDAFICNALGEPCTTSADCCEPNGCAMFSAGMQCAAPRGDGG